MDLGNELLCDRTDAEPVEVRFLLKYANIVLNPIANLLRGLPTMFKPDLDI